MRSAAVKNDWHHSEQLFHGEPHVICAVRSSSRVRKLAKRAAGGAVARVMARGGR
jgi:hypothetical protein